MQLNYFNTRDITRRAFATLAILAITLMPFSPVVAETGTSTQSGTDTTPPEITLKGSASMELTTGDTYEDPGATASDDTDGDLTADIVIGGDTVDTNATGTYEVTYNVSDAAGNTAEEKTRTVTVIGTQPVGGTDGSGTSTASTTNESGTTTDDGADTDQGTTTDDGTGTSTPTTTPDGASGTSTGTGTDGTDGTTDANGENGTTTSTSTPSAGDGAEGSDGNGGIDASHATNTDPVPVITENELGDDDGADDERDVTGGRYERSSGSTGIVTGAANAHGEVKTDANSGDIKSLLGDKANQDLDTYTFNATGTNDADVDTNGVIKAHTGDNLVRSDGVSFIQSGAANAVLNVANVVNSNVINSNGFLYLKNQKIESGQSLDLRGLFFPDEAGTLAGADDCDLLSCAAEDVIYNISQTNRATVTNDVSLEAISGRNDAREFRDESSPQAYIETGDARGAANVMNVVNTNIIDSNYRFLTYNALGDLDGDLMLPSEELFKAFFGKPNGVSQFIGNEGEDAVNISAALTNNATSTETYLNTNAESGSNSTEGDSAISTGNASAESNVLNQINKNNFGGDSMYLLIRIHGAWSSDGTVEGLPEGLTWKWLPEANSILIYNEDAEIEPSKILPYDVDSYRATIANENRSYIRNNIDIQAITGENESRAITGALTTGDAYASANVMNIANTNVVGQNWTYAVVNIFGDFNGNVTFNATDLSLDGAAQGAHDPLAPGDEITYTYTITNDGEMDATNVSLKQTLSGAFVNASGTDTTQSVALGSLAPGESTEVALTAYVDPSINIGTSTVTTTAQVTSDGADIDRSNNAHSVHMTAYRAMEQGDDGGTGTSTDGGDGETSTSTDDGGENGTTTGDGTNNDSGDTGGGGGDGSDDNNDSNGSNNNNSSSHHTSPGGSSSGGGDGGSSNDDDDDDMRTSEVLGINRTQTPVDPDGPPNLLLTKSADTDSDGVVAAGTNVNYTITVFNQGGEAYDATVYDTLRNPIGSVLSEQSWDLGTILPGEEIQLDYTSTYSEKTPSGTYTNTARIEAFGFSALKELGGFPLYKDKAVHTIEIEGVDLAVGNVRPLVFFPQASGGVGALLSWETSKPSQSRVYFGPQGVSSYFAPRAENYGYPEKSAMFPEEKTKHYMILMGLTRGTTYDYRIHAEKGTTDAFGGDYTLSVPSVVSRLTLAFPTPGRGQLAGAQTTSAPKPTPAHVPASAPKASAVPTPKSEPDSSAPAAKAQQPKTQEEKKGGFGGFVEKATDTLFGFFR